MHETVRFWLDRGVDGFRIDVAHYVMKDPDLLNNPPAPLQDGESEFKSMGEYDEWNHVHDKGHSDIHQTFRDLRRVFDEYEGDRFAVGEIHIFDWDEWARYYGDGDELHMPFNFSLLWAGWDASTVRRRIESVESAVPDHGWPNYVLGNHDEQRLATRYGPENAAAAAMLLLTLRGQPTLYYGDELAMRETTIPEDLQQDPWGIRVPGLGRDGCRTPMPWSSKPGHGFTKPGVTPWLPFGDDATSRNVETQRSAPNSQLNLVRRLLELRRERPSLQTGALALIDRESPDVLIYMRSMDEERTMIAINFADEPRSVPVSAAARLLISTDGNAARVADGRVEVAPHQGVMIDPNPKS